MVEVPDSTTQYIQSDSGKPTKDLFNWMRGINRQVSSDILSSTGGGLFSSGLPCFSGHKNNVTQSIVSGGPSVITFSTAIYNVGGYFNTGTSAWVPAAGRIHLCAGIVADPASGTGTGASLYFLKNSATLKIIIGNLTFGICSANGAIDDVANGSDNYQVGFFATNSSVVGSVVRATLAETWFMGHWFSP